MDNLITTRVPLFAFSDASGALVTSYYTLTRLGLSNDEKLHVWNNLNRLVTSKLAQGQLWIADDMEYPIDAWLEPLSNQEFDQLNRDTESLLDDYEATDEDIVDLRVYAAIFFTHAISLCGQQQAPDTGHHGAMSKLINLAVIH